VLHVIGTSKLAEHFRELLGEGVTGWMLHPMPRHANLAGDRRAHAGPPRLQAADPRGIHDPPGARGHPDEALLKLRNLGPKALDAIHQAVAIYSDTSVAHPSKADTHADRREHTDTALSPAHRVRNAQLLELLVQSSVPLEAVDTILTSLAAEPLPPVDPMVTLLLGTAGEPELAALYERAHQPGPENRRGTTELGNSGMAGTQKMVSALCSV
jgi:hypothetical protein